MNITDLTPDNLCYQNLGFQKVVHIDNSKSDLFEQFFRYEDIKSFARKLLGKPISSRHITKGVHTANNSVWSYSDKDYTLYFKDESTLLWLLLTMPQSNKQY